MPLDISPMNPTIGIETVGRYESERMRLPSKADAKVVGSKVENNLQILYHANKSVDEQARELTIPRFGDNSIFIPNRFDAALYDTVDKMKSYGDGPATAAMESLKATRMQWRENNLALNMA